MYAVVCIMYQYVSMKKIVKKLSIWFVAFHANQFNKNYTN